MYNGKELTIVALPGTISPNAWAGTGTKVTLYLMVFLCLVESVFVIAKLKSAKISCTESCQYKW